uniref:Uncharacterized protein n=1 Tax=Glossina palpalis gambiensis TaxID=67801 RepID=A0A1B0B3G4_9MUSC
MGITKKLFTTIPLSQLMKRVPPEQMEQFEEFRNKCTAYQSEVDKYPDQLPRIDWNYYRANVSKNFVQSVEQFEIHYKELDFCFATRYDNLDFSQYYTDWEKVSADIKQRIDAFLTQSNNKIAIYQAEIRRLSEMTPYEDMTMEQFVVEREDIADLIPRNNLPLFWPFTEDEQKPGPALPGDVPSDEDQPDEKEGPEKPCPEKKNTAQEEAIKTDMITKQASEKDPVNKIEAEVDTSKSLTKGKKEKEKKHVQEEEQLPKMEMQPKAPIKAETKQITAGNSPEGKGKSTSEVPPSSNAEEKAR